MTKLHDTLVDILTPAVRDLRPAGELAAARAVREAISPSGEVRPKALLSALPWQARDFVRAGAITVGSNIAQQYRVRQPSRLVYLDASVKTAPSGGPLTLRLRLAGGGELERVSIAQGATTGTSPANAPVPAGALLLLDALEATTVADLTVTAWLVPDVVD